MMFKQLDTDLEAFQKDLDPAAQRIVQAARNALACLEDLEDSCVCGDIDCGTNKPHALLATLFLGTTLMQGFEDVRGVMQAAEAATDLGQTFANHRRPRIVHPGVGNA